MTEAIKDFHLTVDAACPLCGTTVGGYESHPGLAYTSDHGGPFGGTGTLLVAGGDKPPPGAQYDHITSIPWLSKITLRPCGCDLRAEGFKMLGRGETIFQIEGEEFINPL